jgi:arginyl-tRNA synthetase
MSPSDHSRSDHPTSDPAAIVRERFARAIIAAFPDLAPPLRPADGSLPDPVVVASKNPKFGDFQCNAAMALAKALSLSPREVASRIVASVDLADIAEPLSDASIAGPGFINVTLRPSALGDMLARLDTPSLGVDAPRNPPSVVVDLCGVNLAKQMHVGHLRSTVIGDTIARILQRLGDNVIRQNHVGDWGLPIAMVAQRLIDQRDAGTLDLARLTLDDLDRAYRAAQREADADERGLDVAKRWHMGPKALAELQAQVDGARESYARAQQTLVKLQGGDAGVRAVWQRISDVTMEACLGVAARLNADVRAEHSAGESSYADELAPLVDDLQRRGLTEASDGALIIRLDDAGIREPLLVRKRDGGFLYATTDMAAIRRRVGQMGASRVVYCVDARQSLHFQQVFEGCRRAGYADLRAATEGARASLEHAAFGTILGDDGKPFKTRSGESVKLADLLDEAEARAARAVQEKNPSLSDDERRTIARAVALAAVRYADLSTERTKDYTFSFDRMLAFEGNTGPYLLYALVRVRSIARKAVERGVVDAPMPDPGASRFNVEHPAEKTLAMALLRYPQALREAGASLEPHRVCQYAYELATSFSAFFDACPVVGAAEATTRASRLALCALTERVLSDALGVLGIPTLERM